LRRSGPAIFLQQKVSFILFLTERPNSAQVRSSAKLRRS
jgi:hypothetical protein